MNPFTTRYGHFSLDGSEYVITTPRTPRPWINVISNGDYGLTISQTGGGYSWRTNAQLNRVTRWEQDLIEDDWGKYIYLRDEKNNVWSAGWKPVCAEPDAYRCRHGPGYSVIESTNHGIETELLVFVPVDEPLEIWRLAIRNTSRRTRRLSLYTYFEWCLGQAPDWHREFHRSFIQTDYDARSQAILATKRLWEVPTPRGHWNTEWPYAAFHSSSVKPESYDTDKESFIGMYRTQSSPKGIASGKLQQRKGNWLDPIASLQVKVTVRPGGSTTVCFTLGAANSRKEALRYVHKYRRLVQVNAALEQVRNRWQSLLETTTVDTPDEAMNFMQNTWLKYQAISGRIWGRSAYYQTGGAYGFRDQLQDSQVWLAIDPKRALEQIKLHARHQFKDGSVQHWWHPLSEIGLRNQISDNLLWLPYVANSYLQETDDLDALDLKEPWVDDTVGSSLYEHCTQAVDLSLGRLSPRGLPLIGGGDWNDGLSAVGLEMKGESIWLAHFLHRILLDIARIARRRKDDRKSEFYATRARELKRAINAFGWDGGWYYGATKDSGGKIGSKDNSEGSVWLNPQTWAIIADVADAPRADKVMDVVEKKLEVDIGPLLLQPAYKTPDEYIGYLTRYSPGMRENGGVYTHAATWAVAAAAKLGRGESAYRMYAKLNPIHRGKEAERYYAEPYVTAGNIEGPSSAFYGRGGWTWYSGSAAWLYKVGLEWILGVRATFDGLLVDPCVPRSWKHFTVRRLFRGATYNISVENPGHVKCGVKTMWVDGKILCETKGPREKIVPAFPAGTVHNVRVVMG